MSDQVVVLSEEDFEELAQYTLPKSYCHDIVAQGYVKTEKGVSTNMLQTLHVVKPSGRLCCDCEIDPGKVFYYGDVRTPSEWAHLYCPESEQYMYFVMKHQKGTKHAAK